MVIVTFLHLIRARVASLSLCPCKMSVVSPGLLVTVPKRSKDAHCRFKLGLGEWTESSEDEKENDPPAPRKKLKLTLEKPKERWHFLTEIAESDLQQKYVATKWAHGNFTQGQHLHLPPHKAVDQTK